MDFDWKSTLSTFAPAIATAFGSPVAGLAVSAALKGLGITPHADPEQHEAQLAEAVRGATPEQLMELKKSDHQFRKDMAQLGVDLERIHQADRASAREMMKEKGMAPQLILSVVYTIAYGVVLYCFMAGKIHVPDAQQILFGSLIGILTAAQVQILNFWFGSSSGSKEKDGHMAQAAGARQ